MKEEAEEKIGKDISIYSGPELIIVKKIKEIEKLRNRAHRYWIRLLIESMTIAKEKGIAAELIDLNCPHVSVMYEEGSEIIPIYENGEEVNTDILLKLAKEKYPSLHRKFYRTKDRFEKAWDELELLVKQATP